MAGVLVATFHREPGRLDRITARRRDGTEATWEFPTYGGSLPHDLVHLVVETGFGLRRALWGRIAAGGDPERIHAEAQRGGGEWEILIAEGLATVCWHDPAASDESICQEIAERCAAFGADPPANVSPDRVAGVRAALTALRVRWGRSGQRSLTLPFGVDDPEGWLAALLG